MITRSIVLLLLIGATASCRDWNSLRARADAASDGVAAVDADTGADADAEDVAVALDASDGGASCASSCVAPSDRAECAPCAVRPIAPSSGRALGSSRMTVRWDGRGFSAGTVLFELSDTRAFSAITHQQRAPRRDGQMTVDARALVDGRRHYWRLTATSDDGRSGERSTPWHVFVDAAGAPMDVELPPRFTSDADPTPRALAGAPRHDANRGAAAIIGRAARAIDFTVDRIVAPTALEPDASFGRAVAVVGDVDGDGYVEYAVSSARLSPDSTTAVPAGTVWIFDGAARRPAVALRRGVDRDSFGFALSPAGDLDRDGYADFVVGAPGKRAAASVGCESGSAWVQFGSPGFFDGALPSLVELSTESDGGLTRIGSVVLGGYDFDGEPGDDIAIGAPAFGDAPCGQPSADRSGRVYVFRGGAGRSLTRPYVLSTQSRTELTGRFGYAMTAARPAGRARAQLVIGAIELAMCPMDNACRFGAHRGVTLFDARDFRSAPTLDVSLVRIGTLAQSTSGSGEETRVLAMDADRDGDVEFVVSNWLADGTGVVWRKEIGPWPMADAALLGDPSTLALSTPMGARRGASLAAFSATSATPAMLFVGAAGTFGGTDASLHVLFWTGASFVPSRLDPPMGVEWTGVGLPAW